MVENLQILVKGAKIDPLMPTTQDIKEYEQFKSTF